MSDFLTLKVIGHMECDLDEKFGVPRQSGLCPDLTGRIILSEEYNVREAFREIERYSHLWLLWWFHMMETEKFSPTVRPPRLGGNVRVGVFASRSPNRPNPIGLSCVKLDRVEWDSPRGTVLHVSGIDMMNGTPVLDIKPYVPYSDIRSDASSGFADKEELLKAEIPSRFENLLTPEQANGLRELLRQDPRPGYQRQNCREYGLRFAGYNIRFNVENDTAIVNSIKEETES